VFFLILFFTAVLLLVVLLAVGVMLTPPTSTDTGLVDNMWGCMGDWMSGNYPVTDPILNVYGILLIVIVAVSIIGIGGLTYFFIFPEIRTPTQILQAPNNSKSEKDQKLSAYESVLKTLNDEERKVIAVLKNHNGTYLQKYIRHEAGLSRLKTHRILARFAERGMVTLRKTGNTNEVTLADWII